jgi:tRNA 2-thiocytidine biosynthesis protein TtcA
MKTRPPKSLMRPIGRAINDFDMIRDGDRILLGVSGGKDSLSLLHLLRHLQKYSPVTFELGVITVDPQVEGFDPAPLQPYFDSLSVPCFYEQQPLMERAIHHMKKDSYCSWCARMKRGVMYAVARRERYNVLALAQHLDDLAESFLMSAFHAGQLRTMKAHYRIDTGDLRVIRPLVYVRERQIRAFAHDMELPVIGDNCPACFRMPTQREHMKKLLSVEESSNKLLFKRILSTIKPLMSIDKE